MFSVLLGTYDRFRNKKKMYTLLNLYRNIQQPIQMFCVIAMIVTRQSDLVNTQESVLSVCYKPYQTNKRKVQKWESKFCRTIHSHCQQ